MNTVATGWRCRRGDSTVTVDGHRGKLGPRRSTVSAQGGGVPAGEENGASMLVGFTQRNTARWLGVSARTVGSGVATCALDSGHGEVAVAACDAWRAVCCMHSKWKKVPGKWAQVRRLDEADRWVPREMKSRLYFKPQFQCLSQNK
jgi:hypothetical protein